MMTPLLPYLRLPVSIDSLPQSATLKASWDLLPCSQRQRVKPFAPTLLTPQQQCAQRCYSRNRKQVRPV